MSFKNLFIFSIVLVLLVVFSSAKPKPQCCQPYNPVPYQQQYPQFPFGYGANVYPDQGQQFIQPPVQYTIQQPQVQPMQTVAYQQPQIQVQPQLQAVQLPMQQFERYVVSPQLPPQAQPQPIAYNQIGSVNPAPCNQQQQK